VTAAAVLLAGCGGRGEERRRADAERRPTTTELERDQWRRRAQRTCDRWNDDYAHLATAELSTAADAVEHTREVEALATGIAEELREVGLPDEGREDAERLLDLSDEMAEAAGNLTRAAARRDGAAVERVTRRIERLGERINELAERLEVPACGGY